MSIPVALIRLIKEKQFAPILLTTSLIVFIAAIWLRDVSRESTYQGHHRTFVVNGLKLGILLFIIREVILFFSFLWAFFHSSLAPTPEIGMVWPPVGVTPPDPFGVPLINTCILLLSGVYVTWAHHRIEKGCKETSHIGLYIACKFGRAFVCIQTTEYRNATFTISDSVYGSTFYIVTGLHGLHVILGVAFLTAIMSCLLKDHFGPRHHAGFLAVAWFWHFVDVVWLFVFASIYWWGG